MQRVYRVYFHQRSNAPVVWSVDAGDPSSEVQVQRVWMEDCCGQTMFDPEKTPCAWLKVRARLEISGGTAVLHGNPVEG